MLIILILMGNGSVNELLSLELKIHADPETQGRTLVCTGITRLLYENDI